MEELDGWGQLLIKECVTPDGEVIQERLNDLMLRCDSLASSGAERQTALEESLLSLGQFEGAYDDLWTWLTGAVKQLEEFEPITGDPDAVAAQLAKHKVCWNPQLNPNFCLKLGTIELCCIRHRIMKHVFVF